MPDLTPEEERTLTAVLEGLALAIRRSDEIDHSSVGKTGDVKIQKFIHEALAATGELDIVTHSWYIAGAKADVPQNAFGRDHLVDTYEQLNATESPDGRFVERHTGDETSEDARRYADFFSEAFDLDNVWFTSTDHYLLQFYERSAPEKYRDLYLAVQELRLLLRSIIGKLGGIVGDSSQTDLSEFGQEAAVAAPDQYDQVAETVSEIHLELAAHDELKRTLPRYRAFTDILEDAYLALSKMDVSRLDTTHLQAFKNLSNFHYYQAWKLPALVIAMETARGPRADQLRVEKAGELQSHMDDIQSELEDLRLTCSSAGLVPSVADYPATDGDDDEEALEDLIELYVEAVE